MSLVHLCVTSFDNPLEENLFYDYLSLLPTDLRLRNQRFLRWQDKHSHLFGKLLLIEALKLHRIEWNVWDYIKYNEFQRPLLTLADYDFNISHSGGFVVCALGKDIRLGIDIEENKTVNINNFRSMLTTKQWHEINCSENPSLEFYKYWTIKESVIKADGRGFAIPLERLELINDMVEFENKKWFTHQLKLGKGYSAAIATSRKTSFKIQYFDFYQTKTLSIV